MLKVSIWALIPVEALACSGRDCLRWPIPQYQRGSMHRQQWRRMWSCAPGSLLHLVRTDDRSPTGLEYQADVVRHRFGIVCIELAEILLAPPSKSRAGCHRILRRLSRSHREAILKPSTSSLPKALLHQTTPPQRRTLLRGLKSLFHLRCDGRGHLALVSPLGSMGCIRASRITRTDRTGSLHTRGSQRQGLAAFPSS